MGRKLTDENKLINTHPELAEEWHPTKNKKVTSENISFGSEKYVWWKCPNGPDHEWEMMVLTRTKGGKCPFCINRKVSVTNSLKTLYPEIALDWDYNKNGEYFPENTLAGTNEKRYWKCHACNFEWITKVSKRTKEGSNCPKCSKKKDSKEYALVNKYPELLKEWNYEKNKGIDPTHFHYTSAKRVSWKCNECSYEWDCMIKSRTIHRDKGCPKCNSIYTLFPELTEEWCFEKNTNHSIFETVPGSEKKVWWKCLNGHEDYKTTPYLRTKKGSGCPKCGNQKAIKNRLNTLVYKQGAQTRNEIQVQKINTLLNKYPEVAKEWHPRLNGSLKPDNLTPKSNKKVWWLCSVCKYEWMSTVGSRSSGRGCPNCAKQNRIESFKEYKLNSGSALSEKFPELAKEWHSEKNDGITPDVTNYGSNEEYWWKCEFGHEWKASPKSRSSKGTGCRQCNFEMKTSFPEQAIYFYLKKIFNKVKNNFILHRDSSKIEIDIFLPDYNFAIEYDGVFYHKNRVHQDNKKNKLLNEMGIKVIRVREEKLPPLNDFFGVTIKSEPKAKENILNILSGIMLSLIKGENLSEIEKYNWHNLNINLEEDEVIINSLYISSRKKNSLEKLYPDLAAEWHPKKNGYLKPYSVTPGSAKKIWWICLICGDEWIAPVYTRVNGMHKCKWCNENNLIKKKPELLKEWDFEKNKDIDFLRITVGSGKYVWWKCKKGHEWKSTIANRYNGNNCPFCAGKNHTVELSLGILKPEISAFWHPEKNGELTTYDVKISSDLVVWWYCEKGVAHKHEWQCSINNMKQAICPYCANKKVGLDNCLAVCFPQLAEEWDSKLNNLSSFDVLVSSKKKYWWRNVLGDVWLESIESRIRKYKN